MLVLQVYDSSILWSSRLFSDKHVPEDVVNKCLHTILTYNHCKMFVQVSHVESPYLPDFVRLSIGMQVGTRTIISSKPMSTLGTYLIGVWCGF